jgi:opacity protein-like surface antigen
MKRNKRYQLKMRPALVLVALGLLGRIQSASGDDSSDSLGITLDDNFRRGWREVGFGGGTYFSNLDPAPNRPNSDYAIGYAQLGYMVTKPSGPGWLRGNFEVAPEVFGAGVFHGPGHYVAGGTLWFRYNFVPKRGRFSPFIELGGGGTAIDIPHNYDGKDFNFNLNVGAGVRYFITPRCSLNAEYRFQHISNANLWNHNIGLNTSGPMMGLSLFF